MSRSVRSKLSGYRIHLVSLFVIIYYKSVKPAHDVSFLFELEIWVSWTPMNYLTSNSETAENPPFTSVYSVNLSTNGLWKKYSGRLCSVISALCKGHMCWSRTPTSQQVWWSGSNAQISVCLYAGAFPWTHPPLLCCSCLVLLPEARCVRKNGISCGKKLYLLCLFLRDETLS